MIGGFGFSMLAFYVAVFLNVPLSLLLLALYRRAVLKEMRKETGKFPTVSVSYEESSDSTQSDTALAIDVIDSAARLTMTRAATNYSSASLRRTTLVFVVAGMLFVLVITLGWYLSLGGRFYFVWFLWWVVVNAWPLPLAVGLVTGAAGRDWLKLTGIYVIVFITLSAATLSLYDNFDVVTIYSNALTILLIALPVSGLLYRPIRAVGMLVFTFTLIILTISPLLAYTTMHSFLALSSRDDFWRFPTLLVLNRLSAEGVVILIVLIVGTITGVVSWGTLTHIGRAYRRKRLSDQSLLLDFLWVVVALSHIILLSTQQGGLGESWAWIVFPTTAFGIYWLVKRTGLAVLTRPEDSLNAAPVLLLLRVFSLGKRSERLFDVLTPRWLRTGSIAFITGPDLATGTVQPNHFLEYLARRISRQFVKDEKDLSCSLAEIDLRPDPDGRYRVNQFFCFADTWQSAVRQLARQVNAVLMDLRSFSAVNVGCLYELEQLLEHVPLGRILLIIDKTTDWPFLEVTLHRLWAKTSTNTTNRTLMSSRLKVFRLERVTSREVQRIIRIMIDDQSAPVIGGPEVARH